MSGVGYLQKESRRKQWNVPLKELCLRSRIGEGMSLRWEAVTLPQPRTRARPGSAELMWKLRGISEVQFGFMLRWPCGDVNPFFWLQHFFSLANAHVIWQNRAVVTRVLWLQSLLEESPKESLTIWPLKKKKVMKFGTFSLRNIVFQEFLSDWRTGLIARYCVVIEGARKMYGIGCSLTVCLGIVPHRLNLTDGFLKQIHTIIPSLQFINSSDDRKTSLALLISCTRSELPTLSCDVLCMVLPSKWDTRGRNVCVFR